MRRFIFLLTIILMAVGTSPMGATAETRLQTGKGRDLVLDTCTLCHSESLLLNNRMTREHWDETITWMQEKQGLWQLDPKDRTTILDYLAKYQGVPGAGKSSRTGSALYRYHYPPNPLVKQK